MIPQMVAYKSINKTTVKEYTIEVCCENLAHTDLEYITKEDDKWTAGAEGQIYYVMIFCPFCGSRLP